MTIPDAFQTALQHHRAGQLAEAEALYRQILAVQPNHGEALHHLGIIAQQVGQYDLAIELIRRAINICPTDASAHSNLGEAYRAAKLPGEAIASYRRALELDPNLPEAHNNLGGAQTELGQLDDAVAAIGRSIALNPGFAAARLNLGLALAKQGKLDEAVLEYRRTLELRPDWPEANLNLGIALRQRGDLEGAIAAYERAIKIKANWPDAFNNLGNALREMGRLEDAESAFRRAIALKPEHPEAHGNLGVVLAAQGRLDEAISAFHRRLCLQPDSVDTQVNLADACVLGGRLDEALDLYRRALEQEPRHPRSHAGIGNVLKDKGRPGEALAEYRRAQQIQPDDAGVQSSLIYALYLQPGLDPLIISEEHTRWNRRFSDSVKQNVRPHASGHSSEQRLRIGYVSPDLCDRVVARNILPLLRCHEHRNFEIVCYSGAANLDAMTERLRSHVDLWRGAVGLSDQRLDDMIREDGVDILVDLAQHTADNRLTAFARVPAPVQVSFAGYPESAGVDAIEYRISDRWLEADASEILDGRSEIGWRRDPRLRTSDSHLRPAEQVFLIDSFWCYDPCGVDIAINDLPVIVSGSVTFGSLNSFCKVNDGVLRLWARVLGAVKESRLILLSAFGSHRQRTVEFLEQLGVAADRVEFVEPRPRAAYLELYHRLDIVLDTFPYGGHTTSLDALWMGVPVVSLAGERPVSRAGLSQLSNLKLRELVAFSEDEYVKIASELAGDVPRLAGLRATLRSRMEGSVLMDAPHFARQIEAAYRAMWRQWCAR